MVGALHVGVGFMQVLQEVRIEGSIVGNVVDTQVVVYVDDFETVECLSTSSLVEYQDLECNFTPAGWREGIMFDVSCMGG